MCDGVFIIIGHAYRGPYTFEVYACRGYGVIAPHLTTTNGCAEALARACERYEPIDESLRSGSIVDMLRIGYQAVTASFERGEHPAHNIVVGV